MDYTPEVKSASENPWKMVAWETVLSYWEGNFSGATGCV